jgi:hypothetical protein
VRVEAANGLLFLGPDAAPAIPKLIELATRPDYPDVEDRDRVHALLVLASLATRTPQLTAALSRLRDDTDPAVRGAALNLDRSLGPPTSRSGRPPVEVAARSGA